MEGETLTKIRSTTTGFKILFENNLGNMIIVVWINHLMNQRKFDTGVIQGMMCKLCKYSCGKLSTRNITLGS